MNHFFHFTHAPSQCQTEATSPTSQARWPFPHINEDWRGSIRWQEDRSPGDGSGRRSHEEKESKFQQTTLPASRPKPSTAVYMASSRFSTRHIHDCVNLTDTHRVGLQCAAVNLSREKGHQLFSDNWEAVSSLDWQRFSQTQWGLIIWLAECETSE